MVERRRRCCARSALDVSVRARECSGGRGAWDAGESSEGRESRRGAQRARVRDAEMRRWRRMGPVAFRDRRWGLFAKPPESSVYSFRVCIRSWAAIGFGVLRLGNLGLAGWMSSPL
jgi:hypothetical protein